MWRDVVGPTANVSIMFAHIKRSRYGSPRPFRAAQPFWLRYNERTSTDSLLTRWIKAILAPRVRWRTLTLASVVAFADPRRPLSQALGCITPNTRTVFWSARVLRIAERQMRLYKRIIRYAGRQAPSRDLSAERNK